MAERVKRKRLNNGQAAVSLNVPAEKTFLGHPSAPATGDDRAKWRGFCEIESEPAFFNAMLKDFGVRDVKVSEIVSLDDEFIQYIPRPVYGLIFLFKWKEDDPDKQEPSCPAGLWFANQTINNACASVALLNIANNIPGVELGEHLQQFKEFTADFTPALRGDAVSKFGFIQRIHNSFARKMDMLNGDLQLKNDANSDKKGKAVGGEKDDSDAGFHFIAFVPFDDHLWKLDGLERQPQNLGSCKDEDWLRLAKPVIEARMANSDDGQMEFAILGLVKNPLLTLVPKLAENVKSLQALTGRLDQIKPDWRDFMTTMNGGQGLMEEDVLLDAESSYALELHGIEQAILSPADQKIIQGDNAEELIAFRRDLTTKQASLRASIKEEQQAVHSDEQRAASRRHDFGPFIAEWAVDLARKKEIQTVAEDDSEDEG